MAEEVEEEVAALESIYPDSCVVLRRFPPLVEVALRPHTGEDATVQYVQANLIIRAGPQYPDEPPQMELRETKGLDDARHMALLRRLRELARSGCPGPVLVALCEEAKELLTAMNQPDGACCICMAPVVTPPGDPGPPLHFMKLMSCFHCFHSECFGKWWRWESGHLAEQQKEAKKDLSDGAPCVRCPVCRTPVTSEDVAHVRNFIDDARPSSTASEAEDEGSGVAAVPEVLLTETERERRAQFAESYRAQQARGGIIEPKRPDVLLPGIIVVPSAPSPPPTTTTQTPLHQEGGGLHPPTPPTPTPPRGGEREGPAPALGTQVPPAESLARPATPPAALRPLPRPSRLRSCGAPRTGGAGGGNVKGTQAAGGGHLPAHRASRAATSQGNHQPQQPACPSEPLAAPAAASASAQWWPSTGVECTQDQEEGQGPPLGHAAGGSRGRNRRRGIRGGPGRGNRGGAVTPSLGGREGSSDKQARDGVVHGDVEGTAGEGRKVL